MEKGSKGKQMKLLSVPAQEWKMFVKNWINNQSSSSLIKVSGWKMTTADKFKSFR